LLINSKCKKVVVISIMVERASRKMTFNVVLKVSTSNLSDVPVCGA
jgi:hypothetical protein